MVVIIVHKQELIISQIILIVFESRGIEHVYVLRLAYMLDTTVFVFQFIYFKEEEKNGILHNCILLMSSIIYIHFMHL